MGLKEVVERLAGKRSGARRGSRGSRVSRERKRAPDEATVQVPAGGVPPRQPGQDTPLATARPGTAPPPAQSPPPYAPPPPQPAPPPAYAPPPPAAAPQPRPPASPPPSKAAAANAATQYVEIPDVHRGELVGVLVGIGGELKGKMYAVREGENKLGRSQDCEINLLDPKISREHASIESDEGVLLIRALSDKNPIYLNDQEMDEADQLSDGDMLRLGKAGSSTFRFRTIESL